MSNNDLSDLDKKIQDAMRDKGNAEAVKQRLKDAQNMSNGMRAGVELVAAIGVSALMGYYLDQHFGTKPWCLIGMLVLGIITGFVNVYRTTQNIGSSVGYSELHKRSKNARTSPKEKESSKNA